MSVMSLPMSRGCADMRSAGLCFFLSLALALGACGRQQASSAQSQAATPPAAALTPPVSKTAPTATTSQQQEAGLVPTQPTKVARLNEDGSEAVGETAGDGGTHNPLLAAVASTMAAASATASAATATTAPTTWQEGTNYTRLVPGPADLRCAGAGRGPGVLLVRLPALLCDRPAGRVVEKDQARIRELFSGARHVERSTPIDGTSLLHVGKHGQARSAARRSVQGDPRQW